MTIIFAYLLSVNFLFSLPTIPKYQAVPNAIERDHIAAIKSLPHWKDITFIEKKQPNEKYMDSIWKHQRKVQYHGGHEIYFYRIKTLRLKDLDIDQEFLGGANPSELHFIFYCSVEYALSGVIEKLTKGTLEIEGVFVYDHIFNHVNEVRLLYFDDSNNFERIYRQEISSHVFDGEFAEGVVTPAIMELFKNENQLENLTSLFSESVFSRSAFPPP